MKTLNIKSNKNILTDFALTNEEMTNVRGGENDPVIKPIPPPIIL